MGRTDSRIAGRIELLVVDADYRGEADARGDAWRVALLASVPGARASREEARAAAVKRANAIRDPSARTPRRAGQAHVVLFVVALLIGMSAIALIAPSPRDGHTVFDLQQGALAGGILALLAAACLWWLEPIRASGDLQGSHVPADVQLVFALFWLGLSVQGVLFRLHEIDRGAEAAPVVGLLLYAVAGIGQLVLWRRGRRADLSGRQTGTRHTVRGLVDHRDDDAVFDALDEWWATAGPEAERTDPEGLVAARDLVIRHLATLGWIRARDVRPALREHPPDRWRERRPV